MKRFKDYLSSGANNYPLDLASVSLRFRNHIFFVMFDSKDVVVKASYTGPVNPWLGSLCDLITEKNLSELKSFNLSAWKNAFKGDEFFWELVTEESENLVHFPLELLHAILDVYQGRDYLYKDESPLVCRCFGVRENDILAHLQKNELPTLESLAGESRAGMGCRSCVPQLKRWLTVSETKNTRYYKDRPVADWLVQIDEAIARFPQGAGWNLEVKKLKGSQVSITFEKEVSQKEEEALARELQRFLAGAVDSDLGFFLIRARHFSNARG